MDSLLKINNLTVAFDSGSKEMTAIKDVSLEIKKGEILALVGESGCGKTVLCKTMLKILCSKGNVKEGEVLLEGENLLRHTEKEMEYHRGKDIAMIFQDPMTSLNPTISVGNQIAEVLTVHKNMSKIDAREETYKLMELVGLKDAETRYEQMPHHFSGGMRQRVAIAIALAGDPKLLLADEPTTALDIATQQQILNLLKNIQQEKKIAIVFITHDLSLVENFADRVAIMQNGKIVEIGYVSDVFENPTKDYTKRLLSFLNYGKGRGHSHGQIHFQDSIVHGEVLIEVSNLCKYFKIGKERVSKVLENINMNVYRGEVLGIVGPSGCGKSTLAKCIMQIYEPSAGEIVYFNKKDNGETREKKDGIIYGGNWKQMIFQDSASAFNERMTLGKIIGEPLRIITRRATRRETILKLMAEVELPAELIDRHPYEVSGGQRQRAAIARAISTNPQLIVADEPISSLDVSIQAQIIHLFKKLQEERGLTLILIAHDLPMVQHISDRIINLQCK